MILIKLLKLLVFPQEHLQRHHPYVFSIRTLPFGYTALHTIALLYNKGESDQLCAACETCYPVRLIQIILPDNLRVFASFLHARNTKRFQLTLFAEQGFLVVGLVNNESRYAFLKPIPGSYAPRPFS